MIIYFRLRAAKINYPPVNKNGEKEKSSKKNGAEF